MSLTIRSNSAGMDNNGVNLVRKAAELAKDGNLSTEDLTALEQTANSDNELHANEKAFFAGLKNQGADFVKKVQGAEFDPSTFAWEVPDAAPASDAQAVADAPKPQPKVDVSFALSRDSIRGATAINTGDPNNRVTVSEVNRSILPSGYRNLTYDQLKGAINTPDAVAALAGQLEDDPNNGYDTVRGKPFGGDGPLGAQAPEETWRRFNTPGDKSGVCRDIHQMAGSLLPPEYEARQIGYVAGRTSHSLLVYKDPKGGGYGIVEYGRNYKPEDITRALGRPAQSYEEALMAIRPEAKVIFRWSEPEKGKQGHVQSVFYTQAHQNYFQSLNLNFGKDVPNYAISFDTNQGLQVSGAAGPVRAKAGWNPGSPGDPTGAGSVYATVGIGHRGSNPNNYVGVSLGVMHRPNEASGDVGSNKNSPNPTTLVGARFDWNVNPFGPHRWANNVYGGVNFGGTLGVGLPFNNLYKTDAGGVQTGDYGFDGDMLTGMIQANTRLSYDVNARVNSNWTLGGSVFVAPDLYLTAASIGMGNTSPLGNVGANVYASYHRGPWAFTTQAQVLGLQSNNLEATGARSELSYTRGRFSVGGSMGVMDSNEGVRWTNTQFAGVSLIPNYLNFSLTAQQQAVVSGEGSIYMPRGAGVFGLGFSGSL